jgi:hypothetical protein
VKLNPRLSELLDRLVAPGNPHSKFSASEFHELHDAVRGIIGHEEQVLPLQGRDILDIANAGESISAIRALQTFAQESNWVQLYDAKTSSKDYSARACEWAFIGSVRPPYELAQQALLSACQPT